MNMPVSPPFFLLDSSFLMLGSHWVWHCWWERPELIIYTILKALGKIALLCSMLLNCTLRGLKIWLPNEWYILTISTAPAPIMSMRKSKSFLSLDFLKAESVDSVSGVLEISRFHCLLSMALYSSTIFRYCIFWLSYTFSRIFIYLSKAAVSSLCNFDSISFSYCERWSWDFCNFGSKDTHLFLLIRRLVVTFYMFLFQASWIKPVAT